MQDSTVCLQGHVNYQFCCANTQILYHCGMNSEEGGSNISAAKSIFTVHAIFGYIRSILLSDSRSFEQVFG